MGSNQEKNSLKKKSVTAFMWSGAGVFMQQGLQLVISIVLARILVPEDFGTIALLYVFIGVASVFIGAGLPAALIQSKSITQTDKSTVFWFNLFMGGIMAIVMIIAAPFISRFFGYQVLIQLTYVFALKLVINALGGIQLTLYSKRLDFKTPMAIGVCAAIGSGTIAIIMAYKGFGIWALACQVLTTDIITTVLLWVLSPWRPTMEFSLQSARRLFGFGSYLMMAALLDTAYTNFYTILIGKVYDVRQLGFFQRADRTKQIPIDVLSKAFGNVAFPIFSAVSENKTKFRKGVRLSLMGLMLVNVPMMFGMIVTADNVVLVLLGEKWLPVVPLLRVLCVAGLFWPLQVVNLNVLKALGYSHLFFRLEVIKKMFGMFFMVGGVYFGVKGIAWGRVISALIAFLINAYYTGKYLDYGWFEQIKDVLPVLLVALVMVISVYIVSLYVSGSCFFIFALQVLTGCVVFSGVAVLCRLESVGSVLRLFFKRSS